MARSWLSFCRRPVIKSGRWGLNVIVLGYDEPSRSSRKRRNKQSKPASHNHALRSPGCKGTYPKTLTMIDHLSDLTYTESLIYIYITSSCTVAFRVISNCLIILSCVHKEGKFSQASRSLGTFQSPQVSNEGEENWLHAVVQK